MVQQNIEGAAHRGGACGEIEAADDLGAVALQTLDVLRVGRRHHLRSRLDGELDRETAHRAVRAVRTVDQAISHAEAPASSLAPLVESLRSIVGSLDIDSKLF